MANHRAAAVLVMVSLLVAVALSGADVRPTVRPEKTSSAVLGGANHDTHGRGMQLQNSDPDVTGLADAAAAAVVDPDCDGEEENHSSHKHHHKHHPKHHGKDDENEYPDHKRHGGDDEDGYQDHKHHGDDDVYEYPDHKHHGSDDDGEYPDHPMHPEHEHTEESPYPAADSVAQELCSDCEEPKTTSPPPCNTCEEPKTPPPPPCNTCEEPKDPELKCNKVHAVRDGETCYSVGQCAGLGQDDFLRFNPNICCDNLFVGQWVCLDATCDA